MVAGQLDVVAVAVVVAAAVVVLVVAVIVPEPAVVGDFVVAEVAAARVVAVLESVAHLRLRGVGVVLARVLGVVHSASIVADVE